MALNSTPVGVSKSSHASECTGPSGAPTTHLGPLVPWGILGAAFPGCPPYEQPAVPQRHRQHNGDLVAGPTPHPAAIAPGLR